MGGNDHDAVFFIGIDEIDVSACAERIDPGKGFVKHEDIRLMDDRRAEGDLLFHAGGIGTDALVEVIRVAEEEREKLPDLLFCLCRSIAERNELQVFEGAELVEEGFLAKQDADAASYGSGIRGIGGPFDNDVPFI